MALERRTITATALVFVAAFMQGCNKTVRDQDWEGYSKLNTSWRTPGMPGYEDASDFCKLEWSYYDQESWAGLPGSKCGHEGDQAPIALDTANIIDNTSAEGEHRLGPPQWLQGTEKLGVVQAQNRHEWAFDVDGGLAGITWKGKVFNLTSFHLHTPSEHTLDIHDGYGPQRFPAEMHFINTAEDGDILVVAVLYIIDKTDEELAKLAFDIGAIRQGDIPVNNTVKQIINNPYHWPLTRYHIDTYYTYQGSMTTPPCETGVTWMVMKQTRMMNQFQLSQYSGALQAASCDSLPSSHRWVDNVHANPRGAPPNCNAAHRNVYHNGRWQINHNDTDLPNCNPTPYRTHCSLLARIPLLGSSLPCPFTTQHQSWMAYEKWNYSANAGENIRYLQPIGDRAVYSYVTPTPLSLQIIEAIFVVSVTWAVWSIYWDRKKKQLIRDRSLREWFNQIGRELPDDVKERLRIADERDAAAATAEGAQQSQQVNAREPGARSGVMVAPSDSSSQPLLQG